MNTKYIELTELWSDGKYELVGSIINQEGWKPNKVAEFCSYFAKYCGLNELNLLHKFLS